MLFNKKALRWLASNSLVYADLFRARKMSTHGHSDGSRASMSRVGRIDDDMQVGYWMARAPGARYVRFRRGVWHDRFSDQLSLSKLLVVHRTPWLLYHSLTAQINELWNVSTHVRVRALCDLEEPICIDCPHEQTQRACIAEIELEVPPRNSTSKNISALCPGPYPNRRPGRCPAFIRGTHPDHTAQCWAK